MKKKGFSVVICLIISILLEIFLFNYKHWISLGEEEILNDNVVMGESYQDNGDGTYTVTSGADISIYIPKISEELTSSYIKIEDVSSVDDIRKPIRIWQYVTDEASHYEYGLPAKDIWAQEARSSYTIYHLYGKCTGLRILPNISSDTVVKVEVILNPVIPIFFSWVRMGAVFMLLSLFWLFRPGSFIYKIEFNMLRPLVRRGIIVVLFFIHTGLFWFLADINPAFTWGAPAHHQQYQKLAEALKEGSAALLETPPVSLQEMDNPYDSAYRDDVVAAHGESYAWDTAYYNGKYYVYFGVVPAVLFYFPYYVLTGSHLPNYMVIFISSVLYMIGLLGVLREVARKWFPKISLGIWLLATELTLLGSGIIYLVKRPDIYNVPILLGMALGLLGTMCFLKAEKEEKLSPRLLGLGTFWVALVAGCRPQLLLFAIIPVILFRKQLFSVGFYRSANGKKSVLAVAVPLLVIGGLLMYYNFIRFGSPFDFGANYNLTTNDMRYRGWVWERIPLGVFELLFEPMTFGTEFPFAQIIYTDSQYMGQTIQEYTVGGVMATHFFAWFALLSLIIGKNVKKQFSTPWLLSIGCLLSAIVIAAADTEMAGILWRYQIDLSIFIMMAATLACWIICSHEKIAGSSLKGYVIGAVLLCMAWELVFQCTTFFVDTSNSLQQMRPDLFVQAKYLIAFWL